MPWIFIFMMFLNAAYFGWGFVKAGQPRAESRAADISEGQGANIQLLSENKQLVLAAKAKQEVEEQPPVTASIAGAAVLPQCFNVGPFQAGTRLQSFVLEMRAKRFSVKINKRKIDEKDYWVFIPAFTSRARADEKLRDLKARGISGFVVKEGVFINSISLNHFSQRELAQSFLAEMQAAGVVVEYRELTHAGVEHWAYVEPNQSSADLRSTIDDYVSAQDGLRRENAACEE